MPVQHIGHEDFMRLFHGLVPAGIVVCVVRYLFHKFISFYATELFFDCGEHTSQTYFYNAEIVYFVYFNLGIEFAVFF